MIVEAQKHVIAEGLTFTDESRYQAPPKEEEPKVREALYRPTQVVTTILRITSS